MRETCAIIRAAHKDPSLGSEFVRRSITSPMHVAKERNDVLVPFYPGC